MVQASLGLLRQNKGVAAFGQAVGKDVGDTLEGITHTLVVK